MSSSLNKLSCTDMSLANKEKCAESFFLPFFLYYFSIIKQRKWLRRKFMHVLSTQILYSYNLPLSDVTRFTSFISCANLYTYFFFSIQIARKLQNESIKRKTFSLYCLLFSIPYTIIKNALNFHYYYFILWTFSVLFFSFFHSACHCTMLCPSVINVCKLQEKSLEGLCFLAQLVFIM
jgi:hypothetical protein